MPRQALEELTESMFYVLMALRRQEQCGIDIAETVRRITGGALRIGPATLYTILGKFEKEKYIKETEVLGRKRTYRITPKGIDAYEAEMQRLRRCLQNAEEN